MVNDRETVSLQLLTPVQAAAQFPGSDTEDCKEMLAQPPIPGEPDYLRFVTYEGRLLSCTYEISYLGWTEWDPRPGFRGWRDLDDSDFELSQHLEAADIEFLPAKA